MHPPASARKTANISLRTSEEIKEVIKQAAASKGCSMSSFIFDICIEEAQRVVDAEDAKLEKTLAITKTKHT